MAEPKKIRSVATPPPDLDIDGAGDEGNPTLAIITPSGNQPLWQILKIIGSTPSSRTTQSHKSTSDHPLVPVNSAITIIDNIAEDRAEAVLLGLEEVVAREEAALSFDASSPEFSDAAKQRIATLMEPLAPEGSASPGSRKLYAEIRQQFLSKLKKESLVTEVSADFTEDPKKAVPVQVQANKSLNSKHAILRRVQMRNDPAVIDALNSCWFAMPTFDGELYRGPYKALCAALYRQLVPRGFAEECEKLLHEDWKRDANGKDTMTQADFVTAMWELVDIWCPTSNLNDYVSFVHDIIVPAIEATKMVDSRDNDFEVALVIPRKMKNPHRATRASILLMEHQQKAQGKRGSVAQDRRDGDDIARELIHKQLHLDFANKMIEFVADVFLKHDTTRSRSISKAKLSDVLLELYDATETPRPESDRLTKEVATLLKKYDANKSSSLDIPEFCTMLKESHLRRVLRDQWRRSSPSTSPATTTLKE